MASFRNGTVTVGTSATLLVDASFASGVLVQNNGAVVVYLGGPGVTAAGATGGIGLAAGASQEIPTAGGADANLYAVAASATAAVAWLAAG